MIIKNRQGVEMRGPWDALDNLSGAHLCWADLRWANLSGANLSGADLSEANLRGANLSGADLSEANLSGADLRGADLSRANLSRANLSRANLRWANLRGANLSMADLSEANLRKAGLYGADLSGAFGVGIDWTRLKLPGLDQMMAVVCLPSGALNMEFWHTCETTHCRAGWAITLAGEDGLKLEAMVGPETAGWTIYKLSRPGVPVPDFFANHTDAMASILADAARERND